jgi:hypothetical protein
MAGSEQIAQPLAICVRDELHDKGNGPARDVFVYLNTRLGEGEAGAFRLTRPVVASSLIGAGETAAIDVQITERDIMQTWNGKRWTKTQVFLAIAEQAYEVVLR